MNLLLDTHAFLWFCQDDNALSVTAKSLIEDATNRKVVSVASCWEIAIKAGLKKLTLGESSSVYLANAFARTGIDLLPIGLNHATHVESLPNYHKDPFDRLLIAQAILDGFAVVSVDSQFDAYSIKRYW